MANPDFSFSNSFSFEFINAGVCVNEGRYQEKKHLTSSMVLSQILKGSAKQILDGHPYEKHSGTCTFLPCASCTESVVTGESIVIRWCHFNFYYKGKVQLNKLYNFPVIFDEKVSEKLGRYIKIFVKLMNQQGDFSAAIKRNMIGWSIVNVVMPFDIKNENYNKIIEGENRLADVFRFCEENYMNHVAVEKIAKIANLSVPRFYGLFRELTDQSPHAYIIQLRLKKAADLLKKSSKSIDEISGETGFYDRYHFSKQFKKTFSLTPSAFRKNDYIL